MAISLVKRALYIYRISTSMNHFVTGMHERIGQLVYNYPKDWICGGYIETGRSFVYDLNSF